MKIFLALATGIWLQAGVWLHATTNVAAAYGL